MISRSTFPIFLTLSVLFILIGIVLVVFTEFDQGYVAIEGESGISAKQHELIKQISQAAARINSNEEQVKNEVKNDKSILNLIEQVKKDDTGADNIIDKQSKTVTDQEMARINHLNQQNYMQQKPDIPYPYSSNAYDDYQGYWLSNNPWSPDYNPNRRQ